ncbi:MAG: ribonuclease Z [Methanomassiliicoccales archaeon]|nr:MAG: ribonuclease Z [Methanomassiliicoccales archaeon]
MEILFLGTGGSIPTPERNTSAMAVRTGQEMVLFDCGEGTQRQFMRSSFSFMKIDKIFITHLHGDHFLGLLGLVQSMNFSGRAQPLEIYGPKGIKDVIEATIMLGSYDLAFDIFWRELRPKDEVEGEGYKVAAVEALHIPNSLSYILKEDERMGRFDPIKAKELGVNEGPAFSRLQKGGSIILDDRIISPEDVIGPARPGLKLAYSGDTLPNDMFVKAAMKCDVMVHEATTDSELKDKANRYRHSTARQAAEVAVKAEAISLYLVHVSGRYSDTSSLLREAKEVFPNTFLPNDLDIVKVHQRE